MIGNLRFLCFCLVAILCFSEGLEGYGLLVGLLGLEELGRLARMRNSLQVVALLGRGIGILFSLSDGLRGFVDSLLAVEGF